MAQNVIDCLAHLGSKGRYLKQIVQHKLDLDKDGQDMLEILN